VLLMDEPLGALDRKLRDDMQVEIKRLHRELGTTVLYVTHDQEEALSMSDRVAVLNRGKLEQCAAPQEIYANPASRFVAGFVGEINLLPAEIDSTGRTARVHELDVPVPLVEGITLPAGTPVTVTIRPEHVCLGRSGNGGKPAKVLETLFLGDAVKCVLGIGRIRLVAKVPLGRFAPAAPGNDCAVDADWRACRVFVD
jgi:putative spermidine/putrescine transport system ATP-binding protein